MENERLWFVRCLGCLSVMSIQGARPQASLQCGTCESRIEVMGIVHEQRLTRTEERCACDERCTSASGPSCNCKCGGKNHGSSIMVSVVVDLGGIPKVTPTNKEKAMRIFTEWQTARKVTENRVSAYFKIAENKNAIRSIDEFNRCQIQRQNFYLMSIDQASRLKTKHSRLAALEKINAKISILGQKSR